MPSAVPPRSFGVEYLYQNYSFHHCNARNGTQPRMSKKCEQFMLWEEAFFACDPYLGYFDPGTTYASQVRAHAGGLWTAAQHRDG